MSSCKCCFLTCIQVSQESGKVVWYFHLFKNIPQLIVIHTVKGFNVVNEGEIDVFLEFPCFFYDPVNVGNLISDFASFSKPRVYIWKFSAHIQLEASLYTCIYTTTGKTIALRIWTFVGKVMSLIFNTLSRLSKVCHSFLSKNTGR